MLETAKPLERPHEHVLRQVGRVLVIGDEPEAQEVDVPSMAAHDLVEGLAAAPDERLDEHAVVGDLERGAQRLSRRERALRP